MERKGKFYLIRIIILGLILSSVTLLVHAGTFLIVDEQPIQSDAVIVLSGEDGRLKKGIDLWKEGYGEYLILSNSEVFDIENILQQGVPGALILKEEKADSTYTNATLTKVIMEQKQLKSAIVVTSAYHMRRSKYIFDKVYKDTNIKLTYVPYYDRFFHPHDWLLDKVSRSYVIGEYIKLFGYIVLY